MAYMGYSLGGAETPVLLAIDRRFKAAIVLSGGFQMRYDLPEVNAFNFDPHVVTPTRAVIIGDPQQLRHISRLSAQRDQGLMVKHTLPAHLRTVLRWPTIQRVCRKSDTTHDCHFFGMAMCNRRVDRATWRGSLSHAYDSEQAAPKRTAHLRCMPFPRNLAARTDARRINSCRA
jgi:hypothetical protein